MFTKVSVVVLLPPSNRLFTSELIVGTVDCVILSAYKHVDDVSTAADAHSITRYCSKAEKDNDDDSDCDGGGDDGAEVKLSCF